MKVPDAVKQQLQMTIRRFAPRIKSMAYSLKLGHFDADDLLQEVWVRLAMHYPSFNWNSDDGIGVILLTAQRMVVDKARRKKAIALPNGWEGTFEGKHDSPISQCEQSERVQIVREAIQALPPQDQDLIWRGHFQPIKARMKICGADRVRLCRAIKKLEVKLRNDSRLQSLLG